MIDPNLPSISCIIPCHNASATLARTVHSVLRQAQLKECWLVDDASTDLTLTTAKVLAQQDARVKVIGLKENCGQGTARNVGASLATGDCLVFLDADDEYLPDFFALASTWMAQHPQVGALKVGIELVGLPPELPLLDNDPRYLGTIYSSASNLVVRRPVFATVGGFPVGQVFRGRLGGEDIGLNDAIRLHYDMQYLPIKFLRYFNRSGSHLEQYLRRTRVKPDGQVEFLSQLPEESDGTWAEAMHHYRLQATRYQNTLAALFMRPAA